MKLDSTILLPALAVLIAVAGLFLDTRYGYDAFIRSGALIVMMGVALAGREIYMGERSIARNEARIEKLEAAYLDAASEKDGEGPSPEAFSRLAKAMADYRQVRLDRIGRLIYVEMGVVCFGTLIWGFGDLI